MRFPYLFGVLALSIVCCCNSWNLAKAGDGTDEPNEIAQFYGFSGIELFKVEPRAFNLQAGDFTGDGLTDILLIDNRDSCLRLMAR